MAKLARATCQKRGAQDRALSDVLKKADEAGAGLCMSEDASRPAWERKYVREIMSKVRMF